MIAPAMNKQQLDVEPLAQLPFLELLSELRILEEPTVACLMDKLIGKRQRQPAAGQQCESADGSLGSISPIQKYMLRLVLFGAGKTILYRGRLCEVVETHPCIRQLRPLINEDLGESKAAPFWVPVRAATKKELREERIRRQYDTGLRVAFGKPCWTGDPRPKGARSVPLHSAWPSTAMLTRLVNDYGYNGQAAFSATTRGHLPQLQIIDRRGWSCSQEKEGRVQDPGVGVHPDHPYIQFAPNQRTTTGGGHSKARVTAAIAAHRWPDKHSTAVFEVLYCRRKPNLVAASLGLKLTTVYQYCSQIRADLGVGKTYKNLGQVYTNLGQFCVFKILTPLFSSRAYRF